MQFQSHVPNFIDSEPAIKKQEFKDINELLNHPWIKEWKNDPDIKNGSFEYLWSPNNGEWSKCILMAQWFDKKKKRKTWWVLGYMDEIPTSLTKWESP